MAAFTYAITFSNDFSLICQPPPFKKISRNPKDVLAAIDIDNITFI